MVPPEEIDVNAPTTLPADFGEWDSGDSPAAQPVVSPAPVRVAAPTVVERERIPSPIPRASTAAYVEAEQMFHPPQPKRENYEKYQDESQGKKKGLMPLIGVGSLALALILGYVGYSKVRPGSTAPKPTATPQQTTNTPQQAVSNAAVPTQTKTQTQTTTPTNTANTEPDYQRTQSDVMMSHQLSTPSRIPNDLKMLAGKEPPPSAGFVPTGADGLGGSSVAGNVFSGSSGPKVKIAVPTRLTISAGVAGGLLIQKTAPVYPQIAREARVSGTVVIQATISKTGVIQNLHVVSGPTMLRQPALDAVQNWRYKPYLLDGEPVDVETTVSVNFSLGG
jgi:TonB family protein